MLHKKDKKQETSQVTFFNQNSKGIHYNKHSKLYLSVKSTHRKVTQEKENVHNIFFDLILIIRRLIFAEKRGDTTNTKEAF